MGDNKPMPLRTFHQHRGAVEELFGVEIKCNTSTFWKALALGAKGAFIGRAYIHGLGAMGQAGVTRALDVIHKEMDITMALCGCQKARDFGPEHVLVPEDFEGKWA